MKEIIHIKDFLVIKDAVVNIKKINVIIGPQANGKSIIAKLLYFFKNTSNDFLSGIRRSLSKRELDSGILDDFEKRFPRYSWDGSEFYLEYVLDDLLISISGTKNARGKTTLKLDYSSRLLTFYNAKKRLYQRKLQEAREASKKKERHFSNDEIHVFYEHIKEPIINSDLNAYFSTSVFVPASRTFFANLQKNIFTFLASNLDIDPFLKEFGGLYENSKYWYKDSVRGGYFSKKNKVLLEEVNDLMEAVVDGEYEFSNDQDWIKSKGKRVNLANASSGQQESLPMLLTLCVWPFIKSEEKGAMFFIEEPEAHLFPTSQGYIVSIISLLSNSLGTSFFLTSHSPYVLSALNNFILAADAVDDGKMSVDDFVKLNKTGRPVRFEEVAAYTINDGIVKSINDNEFRMLGADMLDGISDHFEKVMTSILTCGDD